MSIKERLGLDTEPAYLIDGSAFIFRGFYAFQNMSRSDGLPTNSLYIVLRLLVRILREEKPSHIVFCLDGKGKTFRHTLYDKYKANRSATPEALVAQLAPIRQGVELLGIPLIVSHGCEADDCLASLANRLKKERPVIIVGADKDLKQCLDENVYIWDPGLKNDTVLSLADFQENTGLTPSQWADFQAIIGDSSDNIPGVPGVGPKTAAQIFADFPSLEAIEQNMDKLKPSVQKKFAEQWDNIYVYRKLTTLDTAACNDVPFETLLRHALDVEKMSDFLKEYELFTLVRDLAALVKSQGKLQENVLGDEVQSGKKEDPKTAKSAKAEKKPTSAQLSLFDAVSAPQADTPSAESVDAPVVSACLEITNIEALLPWCGTLTLMPLTVCKEAGAEASEKGAKSEQASLFDTPQEEGFLIAHNGKEYRYTGNVAALASAVIAALNEAEQAEQIAQAENTEQVEKSENCAKHNGLTKLICPDLKALLRSHPAWRKLPVTRCFDMSLAAYLLSPEERDYSWARLSHAAEELRVGTENTALLAQHFAEEQMRRMEGVQLTELLQSLELPLIPVLARMEERGVAINVQAFADILQEVQNDLERLTREAYASAGEEFNLRSSQQLGKILFEKLALKSGSKTKGGQSSTSQAVLEKLAGTHPLVDTVLEYRTLEKLRSTYLEPLPRLADANGRIHSSFNQLATATGRLSSSNPNLQNIPVRGAFGKRMRNCFTATQGNLLVGADYSQIELRVLAHISGDEALLDAFHQNADIHSRTASLVFDVPQEDVTAEQRRNAKTINFGLIYGMGPQKLAQELHIGLTEAKEFIARYFSKLQKLKQFYDEVEQSAKAQGYVSTLAGRRRLLPEIFSASQQMQSQARRQAINTVVQGSAADIIKIAMVHVENDAELAALHAKLILQVHDELLLEVPEANAEAAAKRLVALMGDIRPGGVELSVPLAVDWGIGKTWGEAH